VVDSAGESITVFPLQELQWVAVGSEAGEYGGSAVLQVSPSRLPNSISGVTIQVYGSATSGELNCLLTVWPLQIVASIESCASGQVWSGSTSVGDNWSSQPLGSFGVVTGPFDGLLECLHLGALEVQFSGAGVPLAPECQEVVAYPSGTLDAAYLWIEGDYPVSVKESTWGSVKSLFR